MSDFVLYDGLDCFGSFYLRYCYRLRPLFVVFTLFVVGGCLLLFCVWVLATCGTLSFDGLGDACVALMLVY